MALYDNINGTAHNISKSVRRRGATVSGVLMALAGEVSQRVYRRISAAVVPNENLRSTETAVAALHLRRKCYTVNHA